MTGLVRLQRYGGSILAIHEDGTRTLCYREPGGLWRPRLAHGDNPDPDPDPDPDPPDPDADWMFPFPDRSITSGYRPPNRPNHEGVDWALPDAALGTPIPSIGNGVVSAVTTDAYGAEIVAVRHDNVPGYGTLQVMYVHNQDRIMSVGQQVTTGQTVAHIGYTGYVIPPGPGGAHLHLQIHTGAIWNSPTVNPITLLNSLGAVKP